VATDFTHYTDQVGWARTFAAPQGAALQKSVPTQVAAELSVESVESVAKEFFQLPARLVFARLAKILGEMARI